jgi:hypothetical protein
MAGTKIRGNTQILAGTIGNTEIAAGAAIATSKLQDGAKFIQRDGSVAFTADQPLGGFKLTGLGTPSVSTDAATKGYVDGVSQGLDTKASVRVATTAAATLASSFENGDSVDGVTLATGDRILIKDQATGSENGIYTVNASGAPTRATDADSNAEVNPGMFVFIEAGTANQDTGWVLTNDSVVLGTTNLTFSQFSSAGTILAGAGLLKTGNTIDLVAADTSLTVNADSAQVRLGDASLEVSSGLRVVHGTGGQVYICNSSGVLTPVTLSGEVSSVSNTGSVTLASGIVRAANYVVRETPSGTIDGVNTAFALANTPVAGTEMIFLNGILQEPGAGNDYTISGTAITYLTAPGTGDRLKATYLK